MKLRAYQESAVTALLAHVRAGHRVVGVAPTGSGKTVIGAATIAHLGRKRVLWVAHRVELLRQARAQIIAAGLDEREVGILTGPDKINTDARVLVAGIAQDLDDARPDVLFVDEAHRIAAKSYQAIVKRAPALVGLTATPWRLDGTPLGETFGAMEIMATPTELIASRVMPRPITYGISEATAKENGWLRRDGTRDFSSRELAESGARIARFGNVVEHCAKRAPGMATLVFASPRSAGRKLAGQFERAGRSTAYVDGETPADERDALVEFFRDGNIEVMVNVDVFSEGFDCPPVKCIAIARPTRSRTRWLQMCGRASRKWHGLRPVILDHCGNSLRFGLPERDWDWSLDGRATAEDDAGPLTRLCPECEATVAITARECPECGAEMPASETERRRIELERVELERLQASAAEREAMIKQLREVAKRRGATAEWVDRAMEMLQ